MKIPDRNSSSLTMMRPRDKSRKIGNATEKQTIEPVELVLKNNFSIRAAANARGVPFQALHRYVKKNKSTPERDIKIQPHCDVRRYLMKNKSMILLTISILSAQYVTDYRQHHCGS
jgi:hypothetical protein